MFLFLYNLCENGFYIASLKKKSKYISVYYSNIYKHVKRFEIVQNFNLFVISLSELKELFLQSLK